MSELFDKYGFVELSVGDLLWHENDVFPNTKNPMFFLTETLVSDETFGENLYEFVVTKPVKLLTPFKVSRQTRVVSDFYSIHKQSGVDSTIRNNVNNVSLKVEHATRQELITYLRRKGVCGWVAPIERTLYDLEVFLFDPSKFIEPNCKVKRENKTITYLKGQVGSWNKFNVESFLKGRIQNSSQIQKWDRHDYSLYDHYIKKLHSKKVVE